MVKSEQQLQVAVGPYVGNHIRERGLRSPADISDAFYARVSRQDPDTIHALGFLNVSDLRFFKSIPTPWDYAEVTEIYQDPACTGGYRVEIILWDEAAEMIITAKSVLFDGQPPLPEDQGGTR